MRFWFLLRSRAVLGLVLLMLCVLQPAMSAVASDASVAEYQGLQVMVKMDKEQYEAGEPITATITVVNTNSQSVTIVNLEQLIPEGYVLAEDSQVSTQNVEAKPGQELELRVTFVGESEQPGQEGSGSFWDKVFYGETLGIPNLILVVIGVIAVIIFMVLT